MGQIRRRRELIQPPAVEYQHPVYLSLLRHHLTHQNPIGILGMPPGQITAVDVIPRKKVFSQHVAYGDCISNLTSIVAHMPNEKSAQRSQASVGARPADITDHNDLVERPVVTDPEALPQITMQPVGVVLSDYRNHFDTPRQPNVARPQDAIIQLRKGLQNMARDLVGFDRIWVLFEFNYSRGARHTVKPPRGDGSPKGLFATRSPHRPNPIGLSCVRCLNVVGRKIFIRDHDLLHGTPVIDIKPYLPYCDAHPDAQAGWVDELDAPGPDHRWD